MNRRPFTCILTLAVVALAPWAGSVSLAASFSTPAELPGETVSSTELGPAIRRDGYVVRPPSTLRMAPMDLFRGTRVGAVAASPDSKRSLSAALLDRDGKSDAVSMLIAVVEEPLVLTGTNIREEFSATVLRHYVEELGLSVSIERSELVTSGRAPRIEVLGSLTEGGLKRYVLIAGFAGESRHVVVSFSMPVERVGVVLPALRASLDTLESSEPLGTPSWLTRRAFGALTGGLFGALVASLWIWRKHREARRLAASS